MKLNNKKWKFWTRNESYYLDKKWKLLFGQEMKVLDKKWKLLFGQEMEVTIWTRNGSVRHHYI